MYSLKSPKRLRWGGGGGRAPERGTFFGLQVYERVGILLVAVYERVGKSTISVCKKAHKSSQMAVKKVEKTFWFFDLLIL